MTENFALKARTKENLRVPINKTAGAFDKRTPTKGRMLADLELDVSLLLVRDEVSVFCFAVRDKRLRFRPRFCTKKKTTPTFRKCDFHSNLVKNMRRGQTQRMGNFVCEHNQSVSLSPLWGVMIDVLHGV